MGSCHSFPLLLIKDIEIENQKAKNQCMICSNEISLQTGIYLKCSKCKILLHRSCSKKCKSNKNKNNNNNNNKSNILCCPHCKYRNSIISYNNNINDSKKI
jgi:Zn finger protein HypA/HybF involved in hydrogenase expression